MRLLRAFGLAVLRLLSCEPIGAICWSPRLSDKSRGRKWPVELRHSHRRAALRAQTLVADRLFPGRLRLLAAGKAAIMFVKKVFESCQDSLGEGIGRDKLAIRCRTIQFGKLNSMRQTDSTVSAAAGAAFSLALAVLAFKVCKKTYGVIYHSMGVGVGGAGFERDSFTGNCRFEVEGEGRS